MTMTRFGSSLGRRSNIQSNQQHQLCHKKKSWQFASAQPASAYSYFVYVGELRNPSTMPVSVKAFLDSRGITAAYYPELLKANPFVSGAPPNPSLDPDRFTLVNTIPYVPPLHAG